METALSTLSKRLIKAACKDQNFSGQYFIPAHTLGLIISREAVLQIFRYHCDTIDSEPSIEHIRAVDKIVGCTEAKATREPQYLRVFGVLAYSCNIEGVKIFFDKLLGRNGSVLALPTDNELPIGEEHAENIFGITGGINFFMHQHIVCAIVLKEGQLNKVPESVDCPLPFLGERIKLGSGSSGIVYKVKISKGYWINSHRSEMPEWDVALKEYHIEDRTDAEVERKFTSESEILEKIRQSVSPRHINLDIGGLIIGPSRCLFYRIAKTDLAEYFWSPQDVKSWNYTRRWMLIKNTLGLMEALSQLHHSSTGHIIIHLDIRPENILIFDGEDDRNGEIWKLADFDQAKIQRESESGRFSLDETDKSPCHTPHYSSVRPPPQSRCFDAPEIMDGKASSKSDVWSLACLICQILSFLYLGQKGLAGLQTELAASWNTNGDYRYYRKNWIERRGFFDSEMKLSNPGLENWLKNLVAHVKTKSPSEAKFVAIVKKELLEKVFVREKERISADKLCTDMNLASFRTLCPPNTTISASPTSSTSPVPHISDGNSLMTMQSASEISGIGFENREDQVPLNICIKNVSNNDGISTTNDNKSMEEPRDLAIPSMASPIDINLVSICSDHCKAIAKGNLRLLYSLWNDRDSLMAKCPGCKAHPLEKAVQAHNLEHMKLLLAMEGVRIDQPCLRESSPIMVACKENWPEGVRELYSQGAKVDWGRYRQIKCSLSVDMVKKMDAIKDKEKKSGKKTVFNFFTRSDNL
ncbi:kinase-like protein [Corynespora cassiicola Philippines]|uniref:EKC/KEOPS complex subunit BUD32 n=1 Tax=Corynespora cassiicola Philippines TaxID=1448308 RepID=A0A2T2P9X4_CORCC|nr:kinase-like protein [Corynespora cassiicola Philippines]